MKPRLLPNGSSVPFMNWGDGRIADHIWSRVSPCPMSGCWLWTGAVMNVRGFVTPTGRIVPKRNGRQVLIRRVMYLAATERETARRLVSGCGVDLCCNPTHVREAAVGDDAKRYYRECHLRKYYGLTQRQFDDMLAAQEGRCAICSFALSGESKKATGRVDHCHVTGRVRGILCDRCNQGLGYFRDNSLALRSASDYPERSRR